MERQQSFERAKNKLQHTVAAAITAVSTLTAAQVASAHDCPKEKAASTKTAKAEPHYRSLPPAPESEFENMWGDLSEYEFGKEPARRSSPRPDKIQLPKARTIPRIVRHHFPELREAYDKLLKTVPGLQVRIDVKFEIQKDGSVKVLNVQSGTTDKEFLNTVQSVFTAMKFPQPEGSKVTVIYPIIFSPKNEKKAAPPKQSGDTLPEFGNIWGDKIEDEKSSG